MVGLRMLRKKFRGKGTDGLRAIRETLPPTVHAACDESSLGIEFRSI
jgi:hypothetical protein